MDSGYNTQNCGSNIMDTIGAESYCKESDAQTLEVENKSRVFNTKVWKKQSKFEMVVVCKYFTKCDYCQPVSFPDFV